MALRLMAVLAAALAAAWGCSSKRPPTQDDLGGASRPPPSAGGGGAGGELDAGAISDSGAGCSPVTLVTTFAAKRTIFVSPRGADTNDGLTSERAWRSLKNAAQLQPGDLVSLADGSYPCNTALDAQGVEGAPIVIRAEHSGLALFECANEPGLTMASAKFVALDGLALRGGSAELLRVGSTDTNLAAPQSIAVLNGRLENNGGPAIRVLRASQLDVIANDFSRQAGAIAIEDAGGVDVRATSGVRVLSNRFHDYPDNVALQVRAGSEGVLIDGNVVTNVAEAVRAGAVSPAGDFVARAATFEARSVNVLNNVVYGPVGTVFAAIGCDGCLFAHNTTAVSGARVLLRAAAGGSGPDAPGGSTTRNLRILQNVFTFKVTGPQRIFDVAAGQDTGYEQTRNLFFSTTGAIAGTPSTPGMDGEGNLIDQDPQFGGADQNLFTLRPGSPATERGRPLPEVTRDATGSCRTQLNLGAY